MSRSQNKASVAVGKSTGDCLSVENVINIEVSQDAQNRQNLSQISVAIDKKKLEEKQKRDKNLKEIVFKNN